MNFQAQIHLRQGEKVPRGSLQVPFIENAGTGILFLNASKCIVSTAFSVGALLGFEPHELKSREFGSILHTEDRGLFDEKVSRLLSDKNNSESLLELRLVHKDGRIIRTRVSLNALPSELSAAKGGFAVHLTPISSNILLEAYTPRGLEHLAFALDAAGQGVWDYDGATKTWYFSPAWKRMRGIPEEEDFIAHDFDWLDLVHPDDRDMVRRATEKQYAGEVSDVAFEYREKHRNGHWIWILARGRCLEGGGDGRPLRIVGTDTDITALKNTQEALEKLAHSELRWKIAVTSAEQGIWDHDYVNGNRYFSTSWRQMRGLTEDDPVPMDLTDWLERIHPDDRARVATHTEWLNDGALEQINYEFRERHKDGHWIWILSRGKPVARDENGRPSRIIGTDTDVTEIKQRELEFAAMSRRLELALSTSKVGVWETDLQTHKAFWDARTCELFDNGNIAKTVLPGTWESRLHPEDRERTIAICKHGLATERGYACDYRITLLNGVIRHIRCRAAIVADADGREKIIGVNWDVTSDVERTEALRHAKQLAEDRSRDLELARQSMEYASLHDSLTGLPNRRFLDHALIQLERENGASKDLSLLHIDVDRFKQINDTKGHAAGDALLIHMAKLLRTHVRAQDVVARIGGDEFVILLSPSPNYATLQDIIDRILYNASRPMIWEGQECRSGVSIGIAQSKTNGVNARQLLVNADIALYRAKRAGRNCAVHFTDRLQAEVIANKQCADDILKGLERREFEPFYQPQFDAKTLEISGLEALVRWKHPERGFLLPEDFLNVAIDLNAMNAIDRIILEKAADHLSEWDKLGIAIPRISVNVSARRLGDEVLMESLLKLPVRPERISFELLESIFLDDQNDLLTRNITALKKAGFNIDIDDFGTGHASIVSLLRINPHQLKIDRQLVTPITESEQQRRLVRSIVEIGRSQNIAICAEGVETADHAKFLRDLGCDCLQGYYFARPMPASEVASFVKARAWFHDNRNEVEIPDGSSLRRLLSSLDQQMPRRQILKSRRNAQS